MVEARSWIVEFRAVVMDIREERRIGGRVRWQMLLDHTEFTLGTVGTLKAVARSGALLIVPVLSITVGEAGEMWHTVEKPLAQGTEVTGRVEGRAN